VRGNIRNKDIKLIASVGTFICNPYVYSYNMFSAQDTFLGMEGGGGIFH
jgi:hypothetical protein